MILRNIIGTGIRLKRTLCTTTTQGSLAPRILSEWREKLQAAKVESPEFCLKSIVAHVLKTKVSKLPNLETIKLTNEQLTTVETLCQCRLARMPLQYIIGEWDFLDFTLKMTPPVFIPRPETEGLVQLILQKLKKDQAYEFLEVGCGSGAISLALLKVLEKSKSTAIDCSKSACKLTKENAELLCVEDRIKIFEHQVSEKSLLPKDVEESFDFIVSNPPYIKTDELPNLAPEILYENVAALNGGPDGLKVVRDIFQIACRYLKSKGFLWMEVDSSHPPEIEKEINLQFAEMLMFNGSHKDVFGNSRFVEIVKK